MENANGQQGRATKFCKFCGGIIDIDAVLCTHCGRQVEELKQSAAQPNIVINNANNNVNTNVVGGGARGRQRSKWVALLLWLFLGFVGGHKFYEGKILMGVLYILTFGLLGIGLVVDFFVLLFKPNPYYV